MSIRTKILALIFLSLVVMSSIGFYSEKITERAVVSAKKEHMINAAKEILSSIYDEKNLQKIYIRYQLLPLEESNLNSLHEIFESKNTFGEIKIFEEFLSFYLYIEYLDSKLFYKLQEDDSVRDLRVLSSLFIVDIVLLFITLMVVLKIVIPIKKVSQEIQAFSKGNFSARVEVKSKDEVRDLANSFNEMATKIEELIKTREELLRDVGHELKTPIAKGKFALENLEDSENKRVIEKSFSSLDKLTNELLEIEKLSFRDLELKNFSFETLFLNSISSLIFKEDDIVLDIKDSEKIEADLYYLSIALKNLIDNALKYNTKLPIEITYKSGEIIVANYGNELKNIQNYLKPFIKGESRRDTKGFGLGLSIVEKIIEKHNFVFEYGYLDEKVFFSIKIKSL